MMQIRRLAILNRGEPAMRALGAVGELNRDGRAPSITAIVVYTDADAQAWFVRLADEAICLGPATFIDPADGSRKSAYLDEERVVAALLAADVDAVWVGWGFVAERASFAQRCEDAGIVFVGPDSATIRMLGDKVAAKRLAEKVGVPVVPWGGDVVQTAAEASAHAVRLGYPVMIKAAAGGGGRGIRLVREPTGLADALAAAQAEAELAFGNPDVFLERYVPRARHVEVQIVADGHGATWAVGVRDCSVQRRNQKVIEESASTVLDDSGEHAIRAAAVRIAEAAGYRNAGTVEFLVDPETGHFQFMEVNTRLQVEHPVTEETSGLDLVKLQLHIARGGKLEGSCPPSIGHAVEARLCAEDPEAGVCAGTRPDRAVAPTVRAEHPRRHGHDRRRRGSAGIRFAHREGGRVGPRPCRGARPAALGADPHGRRDRRRHDEPLVPARIARQCGAAQRRRRQSLAGRVHGERGACVARRADCGPDGGNRGLRRRRGGSAVGLSCRRPARAS